MKYWNLIFFPLIFDLPPKIALAQTHQKRPLKIAISPDFYPLIQQYTPKKPPTKEKKVKKSKKSQKSVRFSKVRLKKWLKSLKKTEIRDSYEKWTNDNGQDGTEITNLAKLG